jgi:hypothetical protein
LLPLPRFVQNGEKDMRHLISGPMPEYRTIAGPCGRRPIHLHCSSKPRLLFLKRFSKTICLSLQLIWLIGVSCSRCYGLSVDQLNHRAYPTAEGAPGLVIDIAQSTDGMLWVGTVAGLYRFDGVRFRRYPEAADDPLPSSYIRSLAASPDGGLWVVSVRSFASSFDRMLLM